MNDQHRLRRVEPVWPVKKDEFPADILVTSSIFKYSLSLSPCFYPEEEKKKKVVRLPVQRSVETGLAIEFKARFTRQPSRDPDAEDPKPGAYEPVFLFSATNYYTTPLFNVPHWPLLFRPEPPLCIFSLIFPGVKLASDKQFTGFLEGLGPAQLAGRQTLATPPMGNYQAATFF